MNIKYVFFCGIIIVSIIILLIFIKRKEKFGFFDDFEDSIDWVESTSEDIVSSVKSAAETSINEIEGTSIKIGNAIVSASDYVASGVVNTSNIIKNTTTDAYYTTVGSIDIAVDAVKNESLSGVKFITSAGNEAFQNIDTFDQTVIAKITTIDGTLIPLLNSSWSVIANDSQLAINLATNTMHTVESIAKNVSPKILEGIKAAADVIVKSGEFILQELESSICIILIDSLQELIVSLFEADGEAESVLAPVGVAATALRIATEIEQKALEDVLGEMCDILAGFIVESLKNLLSGVSISKNSLINMLGYGLQQIILANLAEVAITFGQYLIGIIIFIISNLLCNGTLPGGYQLFNSPLSKLNYSTSPFLTSYPTTVSQLTSSLTSAYNNPVSLGSFTHINGTPSVMYTNQYMRQGDQIVSTSGYYALKFLTNGVIAVYDAVTTPQTFIYTLDVNPNNVYLALIANGDLVTLDDKRNIIKTIVVNTIALPNVSLAMQSDGNLTIYNQSNNSLSLWNSTGGLPVVFKNYLCSVNSNYLILANGSQILTTTNVNNATPVYVDTWVYSPTITVYPVKTANQQYYISGINNILIYKNEIASSLILYSKTSTTYINTVGGYQYLTDSDPPELISQTSRNQGVIWNIIPNIAQLTSTAQINWFNSSDGISWLQSSEGQIAMLNPTLASGLANTSAWISGNAGNWWINSISGQNWLKTFSGQLWIQSIYGTNWLISSIENLNLASNISWLQSPVGIAAMANPTFVTLLINRPNNWALSSGGQWWTSTNNGIIWLNSVYGQIWLKNAETVNNPTAQNWLNSPSGQKWLSTPNGKTWLSSK